jgi:hypothetical protein
MEDDSNSALSLKYAGRTSFDLLHNPFILLNIQPSVSNSDLLEKIDDSISDYPDLEEEFTSSKQILLNPRLRIDAELSALIDTPPGERNSIIAKLRGGLSETDWLPIIANLAPLSACSLASHVSAKVRPSPDILYRFVEAYSQLNFDDVLSTLRRMRNSSGVISPDPESVRMSLNRLSEIQIASIFESYQDPMVAAGDTMACLNRILHQPNAERVSGIEALIRGYRHSIEREYSLLNSELDIQSSSIQTDFQNEPLVTGLLESLRRWGILSEPLQILEAYKGRDDAESRSIYNKMHSVAVALANDHKQYDLAYRITTASITALSGLPRASEELNKDRTVLKETMAAELAEPLALFVTDLMGNLSPLALHLNEWGFSERSKDLSGELFQRSHHTILKTRETTASDLPWVILRNLSIALNNEEKDTKAALALVAGVLTLAKQTPPSSDMHIALSADKATLERNLLEKDLLECMEHNRYQQALSLVDSIIPTVESNDDKLLFERVRSNIVKKRNGSYFKWAVYACILGAIIIGVLSDKNNSPQPTTIRQTQTPSSLVPMPAPSRVFAEIEIVPSKGTNLEFTRENLRYCSYQSTRLDLARNGILNEIMQQRFNSAVEDYNSRCATYRYRQADRAAVDQELQTKLPVLKAEVEKLLVSWMPLRESGAPTRSPTLPLYPPAISPQVVAPVVQPPFDSASGTLLNLEYLATIQRRLISLGYLNSAPTNVWGPQSRKALAAFKVANGLPRDDALDVTTATRLLAESATPLTGANKQPTAYREAIYPPPSGATMNPLNRKDAIRIHSRLRDLGLFRGKNDTVWSDASRLAIREFKKKNGLQSDDNWDGNTENRLFAASP